MTSNKENHFCTFLHSARHRGLCVAFLALESREVLHASLSREVQYNTIAKVLRSFELFPKNDSYQFPCSYLLVLAEAMALAQAIVKSQNWLLEVAVIDWALCQTTGDNIIFSNLSVSTQSQ
eukprot:scaffold11489_cov78-Skeletonema_marinoi.AAC.2